MYHMNEECDSGTIASGMLVPKACRPHPEASGYSMNVVYDGGLKFKVFMSDDCSGSVVYEDLFVQAVLGTCTATSASTSMIINDGCTVCPTSWFVDGAAATGVGVAAALAAVALQAL